MNNNPWMNISNNNEFYFAEDDKYTIKRLKAKFPKWIQNGKSEKGEFMLGEAINGNFDNSKIVLLFNNPGFSDDDEKKYFDRNWKNAIEKCLKLESDAKLVYMNQKVYKKGYDWYTKITQSFMRLLDKNEDAARTWLENNLCIIEWFGYRSKEFNAIYEKKEEVKKEIDKLPTHLFAIELVKKAIDKKKIIVSMRDHKRWIDAVSDLKAYPHFYSYIGQKMNGISEKSIVKFNHEDIFLYNELKDKLK